MTRKIEGGRSMWQSAPTCTITESQYGDDLFKIKNAELDVHSNRPGGEFTIRTRHKNGTDFEHDAAYLAVFTGAGLTWAGIYGPTVEFAGVILEAQYYPKDFKIEVGADTSMWRGDCDEIELCDEKRCQDDGGSHLIMPYLPPKVKITPRLYTIKMIYPSKKEQ